jgi:hypothetical protein
LAYEGDALFDLVGGMYTERGVLVMLLLAGVVGVAGVLRGYLQLRVRIAMEQQMSTRTLARSAGLVQIAGQAHTEVTIVERDRDGERRILARTGAVDVGRQDLG